MKKLYIICIISLLILLLIIFSVGCERLSTPSSESTTPLSSIEPSTTSPEKTQSPSTEPSTTSPEKTPPSSEPVPEPETEPETTEPLIHSSAYVKFDGIDGESKSLGHEGWSEIVSFSQAIHQPNISTDITRRRGDIIIEDIVLIKELDKASPKLAEAICIGKVFPKIEIHLTGPSEGSSCQGTFYAYELKNAMITSYKVTGSNPLAYALVAPAPDIILPYSGPFIVQAVDAPMEEIAIKFEEIKATYTECDSTGKSKGNIEYSWKVEEGES